MSNIPSILGYSPQLQWNFSYCLPNIIPSVEALFYAYLQNSIVYDETINRCEVTKRLIYHIQKEWGKNNKQERLTHLFIPDNIFSEVDNGSICYGIKIVALPLMCSEFTRFYKLLKDTGLPINKTLVIIAQTADQKKGLLVAI